MCFPSKAKFLRRSRLVLFVVFLVSGASCSLGGGAENLSDSHSMLRRAILEEEAARFAAENKDVPANSEADYNFMLGELSLGEKRFEEALEYFETAADNEEDAAPALRRRLAQLYLRAGELDEALNQLDLAAKGSDGEDPQTLQLRAGILATLKRTDEAIAVYRKIIEATDATADEPYVFIASLYAQQQDVESAKETLKELVTKNPKSFFGNYYLAKIYVTNTEFDKAKVHYERALELNPGASSVQLELARVYAYLKQFDQAIALSREVSEKDPTNAKAHKLLGELLLGEDRVEDALEQFEAVQALEEDPSETRFKVALIKLQRRDLAGAEVELRLVLSEHPEHSSARYYLASTYAGMKRPEDAIEQLRVIESGDDFFAESRTLGAYLLRQLERYPEALAMVDDLLELSPKDAKLLNFQAALYRDSGELKKAVESVEKLIELQPSNDRHYFTKGVYLDEASDRKGAIVAMRKAIELNSSNANALNYLGYTLAEMGEDLEEAELLITRAIEIEGENGYFIDSLGWVYFKMGKMEKARDTLEKAVTLVPDDAVILEHLGRAYIELGEGEQAREVLEKALGVAPESDDEEVEQRIREALEKLGARN